MKTLSATTWLCFVVGATAFFTINANDATDGAVSSTIDGTYVYVSSNIVAFFRVNNEEKRLCDTTPIQRSP